MLLVAQHADAPPSSSAGADGLEACRAVASVSSAVPGDSATSACLPAAAAAFLSGACCARWSGVG